jgi:ArsR family transcriptional regulator
MSMTEEDKILKIAKALSDKTRIKILKEISKKGSLRCGDVESIAELSQPTFSHHLKILTEADLLITERFGRCVMIRLNDKMLNDFSELISDSFKP